MLLASGSSVTMRGRQLAISCRLVSLAARQTWENMETKNKKIVLTHVQAAKILDALQKLTKWGFKKKKKKKT